MCVFLSDRTIHQRALRMRFGALPAGCRSGRIVDRPPVEENIVPAADNPVLIPDIPDEYLLPVADALIELAEIRLAVGKINVYRNVVIGGAGSGECRDEIGRAVRIQ